MSYYEARVSNKIMWCWYRCKTTKKWPIGYDSSEQTHTCVTEVNGRLMGEKGRYNICS